MKPSPGGQQSVTSTPIHPPAHASTHSRRPPCAHPQDAPHTAYAHLRLEPTEVFLTSHLEDRVALAAVLGRRTVLAAPPPAAAVAAAAQAGALVCRFQYDMVAGALAPLGLAGGVGAGP